MKSLSSKLDIELHFIVETTLFSLDCTFFDLGCGEGTENYMFKMLPADECLRHLKINFLSVK